MKTYAPSATNRCAVARPMPLLPPVITATFPSSLPIGLSCFRSAELDQVLEDEPAPRAAPRFDDHPALVDLPQLNRGEAEPPDDVRHPGARRVVITGDEHDPPATPSL